MIVRIEIISCLIKDYLHINSGQKEKVLSFLLENPPRVLKLWEGNFN